MTKAKRMLVVMLVLRGTTALGQSSRREPHLGYLYPAGGRQGSAFRITAGGQFLQGVSEVYLSGGGGRASVVEYVSPLNPKQLGDVGQHLRALSRQRWAELSGKPVGAMSPKPDKTDAAEPELPPLPDHPLLRGLEKKSLKELADLRDQLFNPKKQPNAQIAETVVIDVTLDPGAAPGEREVRLRTPTGLTNPMVFQVGLLPEASEQEPNDPNPYSEGPKRPPLDLPVLLNGQIMPGDVDRFRFRARQGQKLVVAAQARQLIPYLPDAVPGWFQATLALYDAKGKELAFDDDFRFDPDPVLFYQIPETGEYQVEIRDSIYRGREDFVYRLTVGEQPFITSLFPLGGLAGATTVVAVDGWNLLRKQLPLDTQPRGDEIRQTTLKQGEALSNCVTYAVDNLQECNEAEPNDLAMKAQRVDLPRIVNGRIARPDDVDTFQFKGRAGEEIVAEVCARRLRSPLDSLLRLTDASGKVLDSNDDHMGKEGYLYTGTGMLTHHADSYLRVKLPAAGTYRVQLTDAQHKGGEAYAYRLRLSSPRPDFTLRVTPSSLNLRAGLAAPVWVHALRRDGFAGEIELALKDAPPGFALDGAKIPAARDSVRMTLTAPGKPLAQPAALQLEGRAVIGGQTISHPVIPSEDMMQAFLYRHLVPSQQLMAAVAGLGRSSAPSLQVAGTAPVRIPAGGTAVVRINAPGRPMLNALKLELSEPPDGITLEKVSVVPEGLELVLKAGDKAPPVGYADNLIVEVSMEIAPNRPDGKAAQGRQRFPLGVLPAISFEVVQR